MTHETKNNLSPERYFDPPVDEWQQVQRLPGPELALASRRTSETSLAPTMALILSPRQPPPKITAKMMDGAFKHGGYNS